MVCVDGIQIKIACYTKITFFYSSCIEKGGKKSVLFVLKKIMYFNIN